MRSQEILNHCFDDIERFMARLQQAAEARSILNQRTKRSAKKSTKNDKQGTSWYMQIKLCWPQSWETKKIDLKLSFCEII